MGIVYKLSLASMLLLCRKKFSGCSFNDMTIDSNINSLASIERFGVYLRWEENQNMH